MRNFAITLLLFGLFGTFAQAQTGWNWDTQQYYSNGDSYAPTTQDYYDSGSQVPVYQVDPSICHEPGWDLSAFYSVNTPNDDDGPIDEAYGGGIALSYFFDRNFGIEANYAAHGNGEAQHIFHTNAVYRLPINGCHAAFAPYAYGGVGFLADGGFDWLVDLGFGVEMRFQAWGCAALFADYTFNFVEKGLDSQQFRTGFRLPF